MKNKIYNYLIKISIFFRNLYKYKKFNLNFAVGRNVELNGIKNISIGDNTILLDYCKLNTYPNPNGNPNRIKKEKGKIKIGKNVRIKDFAQLFSYDGFIEIGDNSTINSFCILLGNGGIKIGNNVHIAPHTIIVSSNHNYIEKEITIDKQGLSNKGITIGNDVWVSANCTVVDGTYIPDGVVIGANSLVKGILEPYKVYAGNPIKLLKERK